MSEISRFTVSGKTFFFNRMKARNGTDWLAINAIYGDGNQQRLGLFPSQMVEFYQHYKKAMEDITGMSPMERKITQECPDCGSGPDEWKPVDTDFEAGEWLIACTQCRTVIFENVEGTHQKLRESNG